MEIPKYHLDASLYQIYDHINMLYDKIVEILACPRPYFDDGTCLPSLGCARILGGNPWLADSARIRTGKALTLDQRRDRIRQLDEAMSAANNTQ